MDDDDWGDPDEESESAADEYCLSAPDDAVIAAAVELLQKITRAPFTRPAELASVAKALHALSLVPRVTRSAVDVRIELRGPTRRYGENEIRHWWTVGVLGERIEVESGGYFYRKSTGGDSFTCLQWAAEPGMETEYSDYLPQLKLVNDAQPLPQEVARLDLDAGEFVLEVQDTDNPLLEELEALEEAVDLDDGSSGEVHSGMTAAEERLAEFADERVGRERGQFYVGASTSCDLCGVDMTSLQFRVDGKHRGAAMWASMCADCFWVWGTGIGWGSGQLYRRQPNGEWLMVGGFPPADTLD